MIETNFTPFPVLSTERLILRPLEATDAPDIFMHRCDDIVNTYLEDFRFTAMEQAQAFIDRVQQEVAVGKTILWVITRKGNNKFMGTVCLWNISKDDCKAETGYTLDPAFHKICYMQEALAKAIDFGFNTINLNTIEAYTHQQNDGSIRLLLRNSFKQAATPAKPVGKDRIYFTLARDTM